MPQVDDWTGNYIINAEIGIETSISKSVSLRLVAQDHYDSDPGMKGSAPDQYEFDKNDFKIIAALTYTFGF